MQIDCAVGRAHLGEAGDVSQIGCHNVRHVYNGAVLYRYERSFFKMVEEMPPGAPVVWFGLDWIDWFGLGFNW